MSVERLTLNEGTPRGDLRKTILIPAKTMIILVVTMIIIVAPMILIVLPPLISNIVNA